jgi:two-component system heavy metal sensor histidine kinase CusS
VSTAFLYWGLSANLGREDDEELADKVRILRSLLRDRPGGLAPIRQEAEWGWAARQHTQVHVRILDAHGQALLQTPGMDQVLETDVFPAVLAADADPATGGVNVHTAQGRALRVLAAWAKGSPPYVIQVAVDHTPEEELLANYRRSLWLVLGLALVACALGGYWIARRGLHPVQRITAMARRIRPTTLNERLPTAGLPAELLTLADTFNSMLDRLEESFGRLARFSADIAHELRTPVNNLRGEAEVTLGRLRSPEEYREVLTSCLEECERLARLIESLLFLARAENPQTQIEK